MDVGLCTAIIVILVDFYQLIYMKLIKLSEKENYLYYLNINKYNH